ncbi:MAG: class I adenylate-forming enzyme family protein [Gammaproteobacteria bacterium]|nr:class I adenylate-forming enzyme family protein [Gammaproteobacteria bacterium]
MSERKLTRLDALAQLTAPGQAYELEEVDVYGHACRAFKNAPATLRELYSENRSDVTFFVYEDERYTYEEVYQRSCQIAKLLVDDYGIKKGDRVSISMRNYPEWVMAFNAITSIGAIAVAMNSLWLTGEMEYGLDNSGSCVLFADQERVDRVLPIYHQLEIKVIAVRTNKPLPDDIPRLEDLLNKMPPCEMPPVQIDPNDDVTILYTSGSTGNPKGVVSSHLNIINALLSWELDGQAAMLAMNLEPQPLEYPPTTLLAVPLFHATGSHAVLLNSYRSQRRIVSMYRWDARLAAGLIEEERITSFIAPAAMTGDLVEVARKTNRDLSSLATVGGGGAPRAPEQVKGIANTFSKAMPGTGWGMTETNAIGTGIGGDDYLNHPGSSGRCSAILDLATFDEEGNELPQGERGELRVRGTSVIQGYWRRPEANTEAFVDGWLKTGDVGYIDDEGYLYIVDRIKDLVIRGGENIGCAEVEAALLEHEAILEATVYAVPDERLGEEVGTTVYSPSAIDVDDLNAFLNARVARFKIPRYFKIITEPLPRIASGKINKRELRELAVREIRDGKA